MYSREAATVLRDSLVGLSHTPESRDDALRELREPVRGLVADLRGLGYPIERIIIALIQVALDADAMTSPRAQLTARDIEHFDAIIGRMVRWCLEDYYGPIDSSGLGAARKTS